MKTLLSYTLLFCTLTTLSAQSSAVVSFGNENQSEGSISYTIGQCFINTVEDNEEGKLYEGNQLPHEVIEQTSPTLHEDSSLKIAVFPNPTLGSLTLVHQLTEHLSATFTDAEGRRFPCTISNNHIDLSGYKPGVYLLFISTSTKHHTYKIIKE